MAALMLDDTLLREVDEFAQRTEVSRESFVSEATEIHVRRKALSELRELGRELREKGITEEDVSEALREVREERKRGKV